jgi:oxygen-independent coproporphyrinogen III oxidase
MAGLYLHIPFCKQACHYCDFHFSTQLNQRAAVLSALRKEMKLQRDYLASERLETVYFGGGTPSLLTEEELSSLLTAARENFLVNNDAEITAEVNPDDLNDEKLFSLKRLGVNRLSVGIQSFSNKTLTFFNRAHSAEDAQKSFERARAIGFTNISIDLIYGVPGEGIDEWKTELQKAIRLNAEHISAYSLTVEDKTAFGKWRVAGKLRPAPEEEVAEQFVLLMEELGQAGYDHYEISNFAKPGFHSRHNSSYWQQKKYLGIGPSAHSFDGTSRQFNIANNSLYVKALEDDQIPCEREVLTAANKVNEYLLTSLRTRWGCDLKFLRQNLNFEPTHGQLIYIKQLLESGMAEQQETFLRLTRKGKLLADKIASDLFVNDQIG